ncbi:MAG TPA: SH3 domain-containing protein [Rhodoferax sp.]
MSVSHSLHHALIALTIFFITLSGACAQGIVSIRGESVTMRSGPGLHTQALWRLRKGYPLRVFKQQGKWL